MLHPAFLDAAGLEVDPDAPVPSPEEPSVDEQELPVVAFASSPDELQELVDAAVADLLEGDEVQHDDEGDIPIRAGQSVLFVRVLETVPRCRSSPTSWWMSGEPERVPIELGILNAGHPFATFFAQDTRISVKHLICAVPFAPKQLTLVLNTMLDEVDDLARDLAVRVQGRRFLDEDPDEEVAGAESDEASTRPCPA